MPGRKRSRGWWRSQGTHDRRSLREKRANRRATGTRTGAWQPYRMPASSRATFAAGRAQRANKRYCPPHTTNCLYSKSCLCEVMVRCRQNSGHVAEKSKNLPERPRGIYRFDDLHGSDAAVDSPRSGSPIARRYSCTIFRRNVVNVDRPAGAGDRAETAGSTRRCSAGTSGRPRFPSGMPNSQPRSIATLTAYQPGCGPISAGLRAGRLLRTRRPLRRQRKLDSRPRAGRKAEISQCSGRASGWSFSQSRRKSRSWPQSMLLSSR